MITRLHDNGQSAGKQTNYIKFSLKIYGVNGFCKSLLFTVGFWSVCVSAPYLKELNNNAKSDAQQQCSASTKELYKETNQMQILILKNNCKQAYLFMDSVLW